MPTEPMTSVRLLQLSGDDAISLNSPEISGDVINGSASSAYEGLVLREATASIGELI